MNCPGHVQIFKHGLKSYRDLPIRSPNSATCIATSRRARCTG
jgi:threonyl-tRNA synthetase